MARPKKDAETSSSSGAPVDTSQTMTPGNDTVLDGDQLNTNSFDSQVESHASSYEGFDPGVHAMGSDGKPKLKADGSYAKKRGRKLGALPSPDSPGVGTVAPAAPAATKEMAEIAARTSCNLIFNGSVMLMGEDWIPKKEEATGMCMAFTDYYMQRGIPNIPPEIALIGAILAYAVPRPQTQALIAKVKKTIGKKEPENNGEIES